MPPARQGHLQFFTAIYLSLPLEKMKMTSVLKVYCVLQPLMRLAEAEVGLKRRI